jgi:hypothetical protein
MHLEVYLQRRPGMLDVASMLADYDVEYIASRSDADSLFKLSRLARLDDDSTSTEDAVHISFPRRINQPTDLPKIPFRPLAKCHWQVTMRSHDAISSREKWSLNLATVLVSRYGGAVYDPISQALVHPEHLALELSPALEELTWEAFHHAFKSHGQLQQIIISVKNLSDKTVVTTLINDYPELRLSHTENTDDQEDPLAPKEITIELDPADIALYTDAAALIEVMQTCAQHFKTSVTLIDYGARDLPILVVEESGRMTFNNENCPHN